ncbi:MAG TPA: tetratricopeptide repeat protein [Polyangiales bacterium]|nr:tetratricopeptide repeat protein [Polyangiales bacterium]
MRHRYGLALALTLLAIATSACAGGNAQIADAKTARPDPLDRVDPSALFAQGERLAKQGDPIRAEQYLSAALDRGFPAARALPLLLRVCVASSRLGVALQYATPYLRLHPDDYHLRYLVAAVQLALGRPNEAARQLEMVLQDAPDYADAHYLLGVVLRDHLNDSARAAEEFALHQQYSPRGLHGAEVAAYLRQRAREDAAPHESPPASAEISMPEVTNRSEDVPTIHGVP